MSENFFSWTVFPWRFSTSRERFSSFLFQWRFAIFNSLWMIFFVFVLLFKTLYFFHPSILTFFCLITQRKTLKNYFSSPNFLLPRKRKIIIHQPGSVFSFLRFSAIISLRRTNRMITYKYMESLFALVMMNICDLICYQLNTFWFLRIFFTHIFPFYKQIKALQI